MKIILVGINGWYIYHFWMPLLRLLREKKYNITIILENDAFTENLEGLGFNIQIVNFNSQSINPIKNLISLISILRIYISIKPDIVHHLNPKPVIFGTIAAKITQTNCIVNNYPGLGNLFRKDRIKFRLLFFITSLLYKFINSKKNIYSVFQVKEDLNFFIQKKLIGKSYPILIQSSGVDLNEFKIRKNFNMKGTLNVGMISRLNYDKGIDIFFNIARKLEKKNFSFTLVGQLDSKFEFKKFRDECLKKNIKYLGFSSNIVSILNELDVIILPTRRLEGIPKILIEAAATGTTLISSNLGGCKEIVLNEKNGYIVDLKDIATQIIKKLNIINKNRNLLVSYGNYGRAVVEKNFDIDIVINKYSNLYDELEKKYGQ